MKVLCVLFILTIFATATIADFGVTARHYHSRYGIPKAAAIKRDEERGLLSRIVGGSFTDISTVPYQVGLIMQILDIYHSVCGGSLVSHNRVITAAHCYDDGEYIAQAFTVVLGSNYLYTGGVRIHSTDVVIHPDWDSERVINDIMIIRISSVSFNNKIQAIALPSGSQLNDNFAGRSAVASGYGQLGDNLEIDGSQRLSSVKVPIITNTECVAAFNVFARPTNICTSGVGRKGTCHGDSGGPIAINVNGKPVLVGVTSFGHWDGCQAGQPAAHSRVTSYITWLKNLI